MTELAQGEAAQGERASSAVDWACECGQHYRFADGLAGHRFWPRNSIDGYSRQGLPPTASCVRCGSRLPTTIEGSDN